MLIQEILDSWVPKAIELDDLLLGFSKDIMDRKLSIHSSRTQQILKILHQNYCEEHSELLEAIDILHITPLETDLDDSPMEIYRNTRMFHVYDELADCFNFLCLIYGISYLVTGESTTVRNRNLSTQRRLPGTKHLGLAINFLKNRPWKGTQFTVDIPRYLRAINSSLVEFDILLVSTVRESLREGLCIDDETIIEHFQSALDRKYLQVKNRKKTNY